MACSSVLDVIGNTPSVWLDRLTAQAGVSGRILAKLDYLNPGFSKKDRAALGILDAAKDSGDLKLGQTVVELTSGNMGTGLAIVCAIRGHPFVAVMSRGNSIERARMMSALGAEVVLVPQAEGSVPGEVSGIDLALVEDEAQRLVTERGAFRADQFNHPGNRFAHETGTGPELWRDSDGTLTAFVDFVGSGGSYGGTIRALKAANPNLRGYVVEPAGAEVLSGKPVETPAHPIQGGGYAMADLTQLHGAPIDGYLRVTGDAARHAARHLARTEGLFAGFSAGANLAAALELLRETEQHGTIGIVLCDSGLKYLSTDLWPQG
ncbi:cysteine synthase family protein [Mesobacterium sp. TK19101]|uniref:Cysteine synthase family protein n=1 Tax=Mesobacterium hydrothermale TaxID=3111907 RepID=A0ABU6HGM9_9RHOB|nr:cysteine synthase family protein [Mesobacterium sp. TK19101]MEC3861618.1 cysteine synthase family protein [Mesobacterium sp. TK19101]